MADILCTINKNININMFYNQFSLEKKFHNWNLIKKILGNLKFQLTDQQIRRIIFMEENYALEIMIKIYNFF